MWEKCPRLSHTQAFKGIFFVFVFVYFVFANTKYKMWENCARLSHPRAFKGNIKCGIHPTFTKSHFTMMENVLAEFDIWGNNLLICFQFETFNFVKICQKLLWFWAAGIILLVATASSPWVVSPRQNLQKTTDSRIHVSMKAIRERFIEKKKKTYKCQF